LLLEIACNSRESNPFSIPPLNIMLFILLHRTSHEVLKVADDIVPRSKTRIIFETTERRLGVYEECDSFM
jgi:hypothetical protein